MGIVGAIVAFLSIVLPWWTLIMSASVYEINYSFEGSVYLYQTTVTSNIPYVPSGSQSMDRWWGWAALALVIAGGVLGIIGSITVFGKRLLISGGVLILLAMIIFAVCLQNELSSIMMPIPDMEIALFSSGTFMEMLNYSSYLTFGFWLALISAILMFIALTKHPTETAPPPPPEAPPLAPT